MIIGIGLTMHFKVLNSELERAKLEIEVDFLFLKLFLNLQNIISCFSTLTDFAD